MNKSNFNIPNILSVIRLMLVPTTVLLIVNDQMIWALFTFLVACITDLIDGYIARKYDLITKLGIWLDPLADKLMSLAVVITFTVCSIIPMWVLIVLLSKELIMLIGGLFIIKNGFSTPSNKFGKVAAFIMNTAVASCFIYQIPWWNACYTYFLYFGLALSVLSMVQYAVKNGHLLFEKATADNNLKSDEGEQ